MPENRIGATREEQIVAHATELTAIRDKRRKAAREKDAKGLEALKEAEYQQGLVLDKAVRLKPAVQVAPAKPP